MNWYASPPSQTPSVSKEIFIDFTYYRDVFREVNIEQAIQSITE